MSRKSLLVRCSPTMLTSSGQTMPRAAQGQLDSAELAQVEGAWWWRVVVDSPDQQDIELRIDPATGEVVASAG